MFVGVVDPPEMCFVKYRILYTALDHLFLFYSINFRNFYRHTLPNSQPQSVFICDRYCFII